MWIRVEAGLALHPKTYKAAKALGWPRATVVGFLSTLWGYCAEYHATGDVSHVLWEQVVERAGAPAVEADALVKALVDAGWLDREGEELHLHDWAQYQERLVQRRGEEAERHRRRRQTARDARERRGPEEGPAPEISTKGALVPLDEALHAKTLVDVRNSAAAIVVALRDEGVARAAEEALKVRILFAYWATKMQKRDNVSLDPKREARLKSRLRESREVHGPAGDLNELLYVVDGALVDDFLMGREQRSGGKRYDGVETLFRDRAQVERLSEQARGFNEKKRHPFLKRLDEGVQPGDGK